jgi:hypothetical protein
VVLTLLALALLVVAGITVAILFVQWLMRRG